MDNSRRGSAALRSGVLIVAILTTGLTAGVYTDWSNTVMPGLGGLDDRTFVLAYRALDAAIYNPLFLGLQFTGAFVFIALAVVLHLRRPWRSALIWLVVALLCYLVSMVVTFAVNVPLNEELAMLPRPRGDAEFTAARAVLQEASWTAWNTVRAIASTIAFGCLAWSLVIHGRLASVRR